MNISTILLILILLFMLFGVVYLGIYLSKKSAQKHREKLNNDAKKRDE